MPTERGGSENVLQRIRMLVTDADGTLLGHRPEFEMYRAFRDKIEEVRHRYGIVWVVCTGRGLRSFNRVFLAMRVFGIVPDYVIARHAYIYEKARIGYRPHWLWNFEVLALQYRHWLQVHRAIPLLRRAVLSRNPFCRVLYRSRSRICFRFDDDGALKFGAEIIREVVAPFRYLQVFQHLREIDVRMVPFTKGLAVAELARHLSIPSTQILVIGDGHNDISMMEENIDCRTACPGNAAPEVIETVHRTGGHIAPNRSLAGVLEILGAYETGTVNSALPDNWRPPALTANPARPRPTGGRLRQRLAGAALFLAALYTTLLVLAWFRLIPFAGPITKPYRRLLDFLQPLIQSLFRK